MTDANRLFSMKFREHTPTGQWERRKHIIAVCIARCWRDEEWNTTNVEQFESAAFEDRNIDELDEMIEEMDFCYFSDLGNIFCLETADDDDYTSEYSIQATKHGMSTYFPDIDYELHWLTANDGDVWDDITIVDNGREYIGSCWMEYLRVVLKNGAEYLYRSNLIGDDESTPETREDVLKLKSFTIPEATEANPHPLPRCVLVSEEEEDDYPPSGPRWFFL